MTSSNILARWDPPGTSGHFVIAGNGSREHTNMHPRWQTDAPFGHHALAGSMMPTSAHRQPHVAIFRFVKPCMRDRFRDSRTASTHSETPKNVILKPQNRQIQVYNVVVVVINDRGNPISEIVRWQFMPFLRFFVFCTVIVLIANVRPSRAGENNSLIGRWQLGAGDLSSSQTFTMDIVSCGEELCGVLVKEGQCDRTVLKPYDMIKVHFFDNSSADERSYVYSPPDSKDELVVAFTSVEDDSFSFYGESKRSFDASKMGWISPLSERSFTWEDMFKRHGPAECKVPIS